jgi:mRNA interferase MazF
VVISQGDIYWADLGESIGSSSDFRRPVLVIQNDLFNHSRIGTVVVCAITSNLDRAKSPGNVRISKRESKLRVDSVINVSQIFTLSKIDLLEKISAISAKRVREILDGVALLLEPMEVRD